MELNRSYQPAKFHWPRFSGSNFTRCGGKHPPPLPPDLNALKKPSHYRVNPITYGWGGLFARTIRLSTTTLKRLYLAPPNLVTFCFYLLDTFWQNFSKIDSPGGVAAVVFEMRRQEKLNLRNFCFCLKTMEMQRGYNFVPEKVFSDIKSDFCRVLLESRR